MAGEELQSQLPKGPAGATGASEGPDGSLQYHDISGKVLGPVPGDNGGSAADDIDLSAGLVPKQATGDDIDLSAGLVPKPSSQAAFEARRAAGVGVNPALKTSGEGPTGVAGLASGAANEGMKTITGLSDLAESATGINPVNKIMGSTAPDAADLENKTPSQKIGGIGETLGEFATGEEILKGMSRIAKLDKLVQSSPTIAKIIEQTPDWIHKVVSGGAKGAALGGAQGAVKGAAEGDAKAGAEGGAIGGGLGGAATEAVSAAAKPIAKSLGIATSDAEDITRAAKPGKRNDRFLADWDIAKNRYAQELDANGKFENLNDAAERMRDVRQKLWEDEVKPKIAAHSAEDMFPATTSAGAADNPVSRAVRARITPAMQKVSPKNADKIEEFAKQFDDPMTVGQAEDLAEQLNGELEHDGYWRLDAKGRAAANKANPDLAARSAAVESIRNNLADRLESLGEHDIKDLKRTYGAMSNVEKEVRGQTNVASRQAPLSLKQIIGLASGHPIGIASTILDKIYNEPTALLNRAFSKAAPGAVRAAAQDFASGAGTVTHKVAPAASSSVGQWITIQASDGKTYHIHPDDVADALKRDPGATPVQ